MPRPAGINVSSREHALPYSKGLMSQSLTASGLGPERAYAIARLVEAHLRRTRVREITVADLHAQVISVLTQEEGAEAAERFRRWTILKRKDVPIIMLFGGATGTGKSTVASQVAARFGITRMTSTDLVRQVMRAFFPPALLPSLHRSSFEGRAPQGMESEGALDGVILGFSEQARQVSVGVGAMLERAARERTSILVEGVHVVPGMFEGIDLSSCAVVQVLFTVDDEEAHRSHFAMRNMQTDGARAIDPYLEKFGEIRAIQNFLVRQADRHGIPVIENTYMDETVRRIMDFTFDEVERVAASLSGIAAPLRLAPAGSAEPDGSGSDTRVAHG